MGRGEFLPQEVEVLLNSPWVEKIEGNKMIIWKEEFKEHFIKEYLSGKNPTRIFEEAGLPKEIIGSKRIDRAAANWREKYRVPARGKL